MAWSLWMTTYFLVYVCQPRGYIRYIFFSLPSSVNFLIVHYHQTHVFPQNIWEKGTCCTYKMDKILPDLKVEIIVWFLSVNISNEPPAAALLFMHWTVHLYSIYWVSKILSRLYWTHYRGDYENLGNLGDGAIFSTHSVWCTVCSLNIVFFP